MTNKINDTLKNRGSIYGEFEDNADITQELIKVIENAPSYSKLSKQHLEAFHMIFHKISRAVCGDPDYIDNIHDIIGYAKLLEDFLIEKQALKNEALKNNDVADAFMYGFDRVKADHRVLTKSPLIDILKEFEFKFPEPPKSKHKDLGKCKCELPKSKGNILIIEESYDENEEEISDKDLQKEVLMLINAFQGKFGKEVDLSGQVSKKAVKIFKQKLKNGEL
jgi:hypothetical protein